MSTQADGPNPTPLRTRFWLQVALVLLVWLVYWNSFDVPFQFDDWHVIPENPAVRGPRDIPSFFTDISTFSVLPGTRDYRPVFLTSMALAWWVGKGSVLPFHLISVLLHTCCALLAFSLFRKTFPDRGPPSSARSDIWVAWIAAALFALHPLATESIVYISSQSVPLSALFYLTSFRLFLAVYGGKHSSVVKRTGLLRAGSYVAYALALMSKPIAITLPINLLSWELLLAKPPQGTSLVQRLWKYWPYALVSVGFILLRSVVVEGRFGGGPARPYFEHYLTQTGALVWYYLGLALVPLGLNAERDYPVSDSVLDPRFFLAVLAILGLGWLLCRFRNQRVLVFWSVWFPVCLLLTTYGVVINQVVSEHRVYISLVGFCAVVALLLANLWGFLKRRGALENRELRIAAVVPLALLLFLFGYQTRSQNSVWSSELTLWKHSVANHGSWRSHMNYALILDRGDLGDEAMVHYRKAIELGSFAVPHTNLGLAYVKRGDIDNGLYHLGLAVELVPGSAEAHRFLAYGLERGGRLKEAETEYRVAITLRPNFIEARDALATLYTDGERFDLAVAEYRRIMEIDPAERWARDKLAEALFSAGFAHQMQGDREGAARAYEEQLSISPDDRQGNFNLAYLYMESQDKENWSRSVTLFERVLEIDPEYVEALFHLGTLHRRLGATERGAAYDREYVERGDHRRLLERSRERLGRAGTQP